MTNIQVTAKRRPSAIPGWRILLGLLVAVLLTACWFDGLPGGNAEGAMNTPVVSPLDVVSQWATTATASSYYGRPDWSPNRALGPPDVSGCSDDARAWASARGNGVEWLELSYNHPVQATEVRVYQSFGRGAVSRVSLIDEDGNAQLAWEGEDVIEPCPGVLIVRIEPSGAKTAVVRVDLDESRTAFWNQIDAVELIGVP